MKEKLTNNWVLKLISVGLAIFMWLLVINVDNPMEDRSLTVHNVKYLNEDVVINSGMTYSVENLESKGVSIKVKVRKQDARKVQASDFQIVVDLAEIGPYGAAEISVQWLGSDKYSIEESDIRWSTGTVQVTLEPIMQRTYPVLLYTAGEPAEGYIIGSEMLTSPRRVEIKAPQSVMERIRSVGIEVSVEDMNSEVSGTAQLKLYDVAGEELNLDYGEYEDFEFSISEKNIEYTIPLLKTKEVRLSFGGVTGEVAEGYRYTEILGRNQTVHIAGLRAVLADVETIHIPAEELNLDGAQSNVELQIDLSKYVPEGVTIESDKVVTITLVVEPLVRQTRYLLPEQIRMEDGAEGWNYTIRGSVEVVIEGLEEDLNALTDEMLDAWLSLDGMEAGSNTAEVHVTVDNAFTLIRVGEATVAMEEIPQSQENNSAGNGAGSGTGNHAGGGTETAGTGTAESSTGESGSSESGGTESGTGNAAAGSGTAGR